MPTFSKEAYEFAQNNKRQRFVKMMERYTQLKAHSKCGLITNIPTVDQLEAIWCYLRNGQDSPWSKIENGDINGYLAFLHEWAEINFLQNNGISISDMKSMQDQFGNRSIFNRQVHRQQGLKAEAHFLQTVCRVISGSEPPLQNVLFWNDFGVSEETLNNNIRLISEEYENGPLPADFSQESFYEICCGVGLKRGAN